MSTQPQPTSAAIQAAFDLIEFCSSALNEQATAFTCSEAEVIAEFLRQWHDDESALYFIEAHTEGDEEGDLHYRGDS